MDMHPTLTINTAHVNGLVRDVVELNVRGLNGVQASAIIWPTLLTPRQVSGVVEWGRPLMMSSVVSTQGVTSSWGQRLRLAGAAASSSNFHSLPELSAERWSSLQVVFSDVDGDASEKVRVSLNRARWRAVVSSTKPKKLNSHLSIAMGLRGLDAGSLLLAMASSLALHQSSSTQ
jgi:hypothetical protein